MEWTSNKRKQDIKQAEVPLPKKIPIPSPRFNQPTESEHPNQSTKPTKKRRRRVRKKKDTWNKQSSNDTNNYYSWWKNNVNYRQYITSPKNKKNDYLINGKNRVRRYKQRKFVYAYPIFIFQTNCKEPDGFVAISRKTFNQLSDKRQEKILNTLISGKVGGNGNIKSTLENGVNRLKLRMVGEDPRIKTEELNDGEGHRLFFGEVIYCL